MILSISYDLRKPGRNYDDLYKAIKSAPSWCHAMDSYWFIKTNESPRIWADRLKEAIDSNDNLFVVDITGQAYWGWMPQSVWDWLSNQHAKASAY